jgi:hypothetical protein
MSTQVGRTGVAQGVHGVEAQRVHPEVGEPHRDVLEDVGADGVRAGPVEVERGTPVVGAAEVGPEAVEVGPRGSEVVVDGVEDDGEPALVGAGDEAAEAVGAAVVLGHREPQHAVVAPAARAVEGVDRQHLDVGDAELDEVVEPLDGVVERAAGGERPDVHLVDHRARKRPPGPHLVAQRRRGRVPHPRRGVHPVGLPAGARVGQRVRAVEGVGVRGAVAGALDVREPPALLGPGARLVAGHRVGRTVDDHRHRLHLGRPHRETSVPAHAHRLRRRHGTGSSRR